MSDASQCEPHQEGLAHHPDEDPSDEDKLKPMMKLLDAHGGPAQDNVSSNLIGTGCAPPTLGGRAGQLEVW
eukprot:5315013-Amphidinium_carterae.1